MKKSSIQGYEIVAGERRVRASKMANLTEVPAIIVEFTDDQMMGEYKSLGDKVVELEEQNKQLKKTGFSRLQKLFKK